VSASALRAVLGYAKTHGWRSGENPARWKGHLENVLPKAARVRRVDHFAALDWRELAPRGWPGAQRGCAVRADCCGRRIGHELRDLPVAAGCGARGRGGLTAGTATPPP
jgi:hypothetical protein